ncbi:nitroreductase/quinone reductase family protein [Nocardia cyriacigeorgica]|jgi:deazaflavin-dependent oxidoreductase (nitroreductase family)|nr:nitroreductase/quinone reductase family protein [Nocardia cyriacigeorgica]MBF6321582.1 nitroreductase family deazaflavin-dependent oxidoreductase [Nocardia cyriacigeorgica]MBF6494740.1 nitroreductase family deazaflavin-dependent oxidoreductase [Nocardia cyriacigeorgica]
MSEGNAQPPSVAAMNAAVIAEFRANGGKVGGVFAGASLILLTSTGARSGRAHTTPVVYHAEDDRLLIFGSNAGGDRDPAWAHNLRANPKVVVEIAAANGLERYGAIATELTGTKRDSEYAAQCERDPAFAAYQEATDRVIPVFALRRSRETSLARRGVIAGAVALTGAAGLFIATRGLRAGSAEIPGAAATPAPTGGPAARSTAISDHLKQVHGQLRRDLDAVRAGLARHLEDPASAALPELPQDLRTHCVAFCGALHEHHINEDGVFPVLAQQFPELAPVLDRLAREHTEVARVITELQALLAEAPDGRPARLRAEFDRLATELETHFDYEETTLTGSLNVMDTSALPPRRPGR